MSTYVGKMRDVLVSFNNTALELRNGGGEDLRAQLDQAAVGAKEQISAILQDAVTAAKAWAKLNPAEIDKDDLFLLRGSFNPAASDLRDLLVKYQNNGTMVNALARYIGRSGLGAVVGYIPNKVDKVKAYTHFADAAHSVIEKISKKECLPADSAELQQWGTPETIGEHLTAVIYGIN